MPSHLNATSRAVAFGNSWESGPRRRLSTEDSTSMMGTPLAGTARRCWSVGPDCHRWSTMDRGSFRKYRSDSMRSGTSERLDSGVNLRDLTLDQERVPQPTSSRTRSAKVASAVRGGAATHGAASAFSPLPRTSNLRSSASAGALLGRGSGAKAQEKRTQPAPPPLQPGTAAAARAAAVTPGAAAAAARRNSAKHPESHLEDISRQTGVVCPTFRSCGNCGVPRCPYVHDVSTSSRLSVRSPGSRCFGPQPLPPAPPLSSSDCQAFPCRFHRVTGVCVVEESCDYSHNVPHGPEGSRGGTEANCSSWCCHKCGWLNSANAQQCCRYGCVAEKPPVARQPQAQQSLTGLAGCASDVLDAIETVPPASHPETATIAACDSSSRFCLGSGISCPSHRVSRCCSSIGRVSPRERLGGLGGLPLRPTSSPRRLLCQ